MRNIPGASAPTVLPSADIDRLRDALTAARFRHDAITGRIGEAAMTAVARGDHRAALAATADGDPQATLIRLFVCGGTEPAADVAAALRPLSVDAALAAGLLAAADGGYRAGLGLEPYDAYWVLADLPAALGGAVTGEHVLGVSAAAGSMAGAMLRRPANTALDLGTGSGVLALHLSGHADRVTVTDLSARALRFAATNAALNGLDWELRAGDLLAPVTGRRFDQVVSNPPFITGPARTDYTYRDSGRSGDAVCAELAGSASTLLNHGGTMQFLANWLHVDGQPWDERVAGWFDGTDCDVWAIQRDVADPLDYVRIWQRDAAEQHDPNRLVDWLDWFDANKVTAVGFGLITAHRTGADNPSIVCEELRGRPASPLHGIIDARLDDGQRLAAMSLDRLLAARLRLADGVRLAQEAALGDEGWQVERQSLIQSVGLRRREAIDPLLVSFLGGCTGAVDVRTQIRLLADAHDAPEALLAAGLEPIIRRLVQQGFVRID